jgi:hypothetical protein
MRLNEVTVERGTQCSGLAVCNVHMNLKRNERGKRHRIRNDNVYLSKGKFESAK